MQSALINPILIEFQSKSDLLVTDLTGRSIRIHFFSYLRKNIPFFPSQNQRIPSDMVFLRTSEKTGMF